MIKSHHKLFWILLFAAIQILIVILHISKQSLWVKISYTTQKYEHQLANIAQQKKIVLHQLYELKNPKEIKKYAQEHLGMQSIKMGTLKRISSHGTYS